MHDLVFALNQDFVEEHPGGPEVLLALAGKDATADFEDIHHSSSARDWADKYIIGYMENAPEEAKTKMMVRTKLPASTTESSQSSSCSILVPAVLLAVGAVAAMFVLKKQ